MSEASRHERLARLRGRPLPFAVSAVGSAWERRAVDVRAVHREALERIRGLIERVAKDPLTATSALIVGQAGAGKTHLLGTLCNAVVPEAGNYAFAEVRPLLDPARPLGHLLRELTGNLLQRPPGHQHAAQLEAMSARTVAGYLDIVVKKAPNLAPVIQALRERPDALADMVVPEKWEFLIKQVTAWARHEVGGLWEPALRAFFRYPLPAHRALAAAWLRGEALDEAELTAAGLTEPQTITDEERASRTLHTLGCLLRWDRPLVLGFDQLENLDTAERRAAFGTQLSMLAEGVPGVVVLCAVRGDRWNVLRKELPAPLVERFERERIDLAGCTRDAALELVRLRLSVAAEGESAPELAGAPELFPFDLPEDRARLEEVVSAGTAPRVILQRANRLWMDLVHPGAEPEQPVVESPRDALERCWAEAHAAILARPERHGPDATALAEALRLLLPARMGFATARAPKTKFPRAALLARGVPVYVDGERHFRAVSATLKAAVAARDAGAAGALYVRDARLPLPARPAWPATNEQREALIKKKGLVLIVPEAEVFAWLALVHVAQAVRSQDVAPSGGNPAGAADFQGWLRGRKLPPSMSAVIAYLEAKAKA